MNDDDFELVSAFVDDEVTDEERARVESDPALRAEADRLRGIRAAVRETAPPADAARESAIAAALCAVAAPPTPPEVSSLESRRHRWLAGVSAAAAVALLAVGGIVISQRGNGSSDNAANERAQVGRSAAAGTAPTPVSVEASAGEAADMPAVGPATSVASMVAAAPEAAAADAAEPELASTAEPAATAELATAAELRAWAAARVTARPEITDVLDECRQGRLEPDARYVDGGRPRDVVVVTYANGARLGALALDHCVIIANTAP
jgi:hypothetical protein